MIILDTPKKSLEVVLKSAGALTFVTSYVDIERTTFGLSAANALDGSATGFATTVMVTSPVATSVRQIKSLSLQNYTGASCDLTLQVNNDGTLRPIWIGTLAYRETLFYMDGRGFYVVDGTGQTKIPFDTASAGISSLTTLTATDIFSTLQHILVELRVQNAMAQDGFQPDVDYDDLRQELLNDSEWTS